MMQHFYQNIEGWFDFQDIYSDAVKNAKNDEESIFVEVGTWMGKSASFMGVEIINSNKPIKFYAVDNFSGSLGEFKEHGMRNVLLDTVETVSKDELIKRLTENINQVKNTVNIIIMDSFDFVSSFQDNSIDFCFIDSDHSYDSIKKELDVWTPKIKKGGIIAGHDIEYPSVKKAVIEKFEKYNKSNNSWFLKI